MKFGKMLKSILTWWLRKILERETERDGAWKYVGMRPDLATWKHSSEPARGEGEREKWRRLGGVLGSGLTLDCREIRDSEKQAGRKRDEPWKNF